VLVGWYAVGLHRGYSVWGAIRLGEACSLYALRSTVRSSVVIKVDTRRGRSGLQSSEGHGRTVAGPDTVHSRAHPAPGSLCYHPLVPDLLEYGRGGCACRVLELVNEEFHREEIAVAELAELVVASADALLQGAQRHLVG
jgi:hypothetical protein